MQAFHSIDGVDVFVGDNDDVIIRQCAYVEDEAARYIYIPLSLAESFKRAFDAAVAQAKAEESL